MKDKYKFWTFFVSAVLLTLTALFLLLRVGINAAALSQFQRGHYSEMPEKLLVLINEPDGYIPCYNLGNEAYRMGNFDRAISWYRKALEHNPPAGKECPIRVNLALAMLEKIDFDHLDDPSVRKNAITLLKAARKVLCEVGCADPDGTDGHDEQAETLKEEIDELLKELEDQEEESESESESETETESETQKNSQETEPQTKEDNSQKNRREQDIEKQIRKNQEQASSERAKDQKSQEAQNGQQDGGQGDNGESSEGDGKKRKFW